MNSIYQEKSCTIVYDEHCVQRPSVDIFNPDWWRQQGRVTATAQGRGNAYMLNADFGPAVLRAYRRGGMAARISADRYFYLGVERSRPVSEYRILSRLWQNRLPVPKPVAALCQRQGLLYRGALLTHTIETAQPFADLLNQAISAEIWQVVGRCIRRFHDQHVYHADLNARNILVTDDQQIYLIDFDRARLNISGSHAKLKNLIRLKRSLLKFQSYDYYDLDSGWNDLLKAYNGD